MKLTRTGGVVLPVFSLPGPYGIGALGAYARRFVDFLKSAGQTYWQVLPLVPTGFGDSPYQSPSSFAGNPYLIDLEELCDKGWLTPDECGSFDFGADIDRVDYGLLYEHRLPLLRIAFDRAYPQLKKEMAAFRKAQSHWLADYALFMAVKTKFGMVALDDWPDAALRARKPAALRAAGLELAGEVAFNEFLQYIFFSQWAALRRYANAQGVRIIGDLPIYVSRDSVEVWAHPSLFLLTDNGAPRVVAGVPPDYYSATGQLWGNPIYDWQRHAKDGFSWWLSRLRHMADCCDVVRIDHFRGFYNFWEVPAHEETALHGRFRRGPGMAFVKAVRVAFPDLPIIAEDLGDLDDKVRAFFQKTGFPGMNVLVYAFDPNGDSMYLPHNTTVDRVSYTSTHDAPSFLDWLTGEASEAERAFAADYLRLRTDEGISWGAMKSVWASPAVLAMSPLQDVLGLGADARVNIPATLSPRNWSWRVREEALNEGVAAALRHMTRTYRRG